MNLDPLPLRDNAHEPAPFPRVAIESSPTTWIWGAALSCCNQTRFRAFQGPVLSQLLVSVGGVCLSGQRPSRGPTYFLGSLTGPGL